MSTSQRPDDVDSATDEATQPSAAADAGAQDDTATDVNASSEGRSETPDASLVAPEAAPDAERSEAPAVHADAPASAVGEETLAETSDADASAVAATTDADEGVDASQPDGDVEAARADSLNTGDADAGDAGSADEADESDDVDETDDEEDPFAGLEPDARGVARMLLDEQIALQIVDAGILMPAAEFLREVRAEAGFRVSPRAVAVAVEQLAAARRPLTVTSVAEVVAAGRGTRSERQQRHADDWRAFGALLLVRNLDGSPEGQREFIAQARKVAGVRGTDLLLLKTSLAVGNMRQPLTPELVGQIAQALSRIWQDLSADNFVQAAQRTARRIDRERRRPQRGGSVPNDPNVRRTKRKKRR